LVATRGFGIGCSLFAVVVEAGLDPASHPRIFGPDRPKISVPSLSFHEKT
jgi:hypothetical protein